MMKIFNRFDRIIAFFIPERFRKVFRYLCSGGTAAFVDLVLLYLFTSKLHIWYLLSAILAFLFAFIVSFVLQKFWTFGDLGTEKWKSQATIYFVVTGTNLGINTLLMYLFVDFAHLHYMPAQIITSGLIAIESYFVYQIFVFKKSHATSKITLAVPAGENALPTGRSSTLRDEHRSDLKESEAENTKGGTFSPRGDGGVE